VKLRASTTVHNGLRKESICKFSIGHRFKAKARAENANKLRSKMNKSEHKLSKLKAGKTRLFQTIDFT